MPESTKSPAEVLGGGTDLRDQFAMAALTGLLSDPNVTPGEEEDFDDFVKGTSEACYVFADAMLTARQASIRGGEA